MSVKLSAPYYLYEVGKRDNMEDYIFPLPGQASASDSLFIVCDGMGGHSKGEVASRLVGETMANMILKSNTGLRGIKLLSHAFDKAQLAIDDYLQNDPGAKGMGTTLVLVYFEDDKALVMHCGDSRFYHFRRGDILWKTRDHSLLNQLIDEGITTPRQAMLFGRTNVITKAMQGRKVSNVQPDFHQVEEITSGDSFFLCTDGVQEGVTEEQLIEIMASPQSPADKMHVIKELCQANARDNFSAYLIEVVGN